MQLETMNTLMHTAVTAIGTLGGWEAVRYLTNRKSNNRITRAQAAEAELSTMRLTMEFLQTEIRRQEEHFAHQNNEIRRLNSEVIDLTHRLAKLDLQLSITRCDTPDCPYRTTQPKPDGHDSTD